MWHGIRQTENTGADHGGDIVESRVPPFGSPRGSDRKPIIDCLLPCCLFLCHIWSPSHVFLLVISTSKLVRLQGNVWKTQQSRPSNIQYQPQSDSIRHLTVKTTTNIRTMGISEAIFRRKKKYIDLLRMYNVTVCCNYILFIHNRN